MRSWLRNIADEDFSRFMEFADRHPDIVSRAHLLQKLTIFNFVAPVVERLKPASILEIGCGLGFHAALLSSYGDVTATELEVPGSFVTLAGDIGSNREKVFAELAKRPPHFQPNDGKAFPFPDQSFDLIFHNSVIEHVPDPTAFNRDTGRMLKPGGRVICITGTPALCRFRFFRDYLLRLPYTLLTSLVKEARLTRRPTISDKLKSLLSAEPAGKGPLPSARGWNSRLTHYVNSPSYNAMVLSELAASAGVGADMALAGAYEHFRKSMLNRFLFYLTPQTHGQHYRNFRHEMSEWRLDRWHATFASAGFEVEEVIPYRFHHLLEPSWSDRLNASLYHRAAPLIERFSRSIPPGMASEFIMVARKKQPA